MVTTVLKFSGVVSNFGTDKLVKFLGLNLIQMIEKFRISFVNFDADRLY